MKFIKRHLGGIPSCYATSYIEHDRRGSFVFAPDAYGPCLSFDCESFSQGTIWEAPSGTMSIVPIPGGNGDFLAVQKFNPGFDAAEAELVYAHNDQGEWKVETLFKLPYLHRFDILERGGITYLICCTVCTTKSSIEDWSSPGKIYAARLPEDLSKPITLIAIADGMTRNHGYCRVVRDTFSFALTSCDQGAFEVMPPEHEGAVWSVRKILDGQISDIAICDIDEDGHEELAAIEPFHGADVVIYRMVGGTYTPIYRYPEPLPFCHVIWGGCLRGKPVFLVGNRDGERGLYILLWDNGKVVSGTIELGSGPSNISVHHGDLEDLIAVANHEAGEAAVFAIRDGGY
jgi:hypothetical protein